MRIAIIVPAFNVAPFLQQTLRSVVAQTHPDWVAVVVDDGSTDATAAVAASVPDHRIRLIRQPNAGVSAARNRGILAADSADAILFLDGDDWLAPDALAVLAATLEAAPRTVAACGRYARVAGSATKHMSPGSGAEHMAPRSGARHPSAGQGAQHRSNPRLSAAPPHGCLLERLLRRNLFANGGHLLIRRAAVESAGAFRTDLSYGEDWEYWTRLAALGEFAAARPRAPVLFVRERPGSATLSHGTDPAAYRPAMEAIHRNPVLAAHIGTARLARLRCRAEAEMAWTIGRELIRHGRRRDGLLWLARSLRDAPTPRRLLLLGLAWLRRGPFRPYPSRG